MLEIVAQMGEPGVRGLNCRHYRERFFHAHVRGMGFVPKGIDDEMANAADLFNHWNWNRLAVAQVRGDFRAISREKIAKGGHAPVRNGQWCKNRFAE